MPDDMEDFDFLGEDTPSETTPTDENSAFKQLRRHANKLEKEQKATLAELEELRAFKTEVSTQKRQADVNEAFTALGLNPTFSKFWALENPEAEPQKEGIAKWAVDNGFAQADQFADKPTAEAGFTPTVAPEGSAPGLSVLTDKEATDLAFSDPERFVQLRAQGRIQLSKLDS